MEPGVKAYLIRILNTISVVGICLMINITAGLKFELAWFDAGIKWQNIAFYSFMLLSLLFTAFYIFKLWKEPIDFNE